MKKCRLQTVFALLALVCLSCSLPFHAAAEDEISIIKKEVAQMQEQYVQQIKALQERMDIYVKQMSATK